jgi:hypothetical protein
LYKGRDTRLDRLVAIRQSVTGFSDRFEREARAIAALNHPDVCLVGVMAFMRRITSSSSSRPTISRRLPPRPTQKTADQQGPDFASRPLRTLHRMRHARWFRRVTLV